MTADMSAFFADVIGSYQLGPLLLEARGMYTTGNRAGDNLAKGIRYYQPLDTDGSYWGGGWSQFWSPGVDYFNQGWARTGAWIGYDRYGRVGLAGRATYNITPALSVYGVVNAMWTAEAVDTDTASQLATTAGVGTPARRTINQNSFVQGDSNYLGTEGNLGLTWRFSANADFNLVGGYLFAGHALDASECSNGAATCSPSLTRKKDAQDAYTLAARVRLAF